jgi:hypothetical protein
MPLKAVAIYLDESGDLGWKFDGPYLGGGSSRYLTITALCVPPGKDVDRAIRRMDTARSQNVSSVQAYTSGLH